jgi:hypothetical protein
MRSKAKGTKRQEAEKENYLSKPGLNLSITVLSVRTTNLFVEFHLKRHSSKNRAATAAKFIPQRLVTSQSFALA